MGSNAWLGSRSVVLIGLLRLLSTVATRQQNQLATPLRSLGMCGLIKLLVYRQGVTDVLHVTRQEIKETRKRLASEEWTIYHTEQI